LFIHITLETAPNEMQSTRPTATWLQLADLRPIIFWSYVGLQQAHLRPIICRSYFDLISGYSRSILGRWYAELFRSYFGSQQADLISTLGETRVWLQAKPPWLQAK